MLQLHSIISPVKKATLERGGFFKLHLKHQAARRRGPGDDY